MKTRTVHIACLLTLAACGSSRPHSAERCDTPGAPTVLGLDAVAALPSLVDAVKPGAVEVALGLPALAPDSPPSWGMATAFGLDGRVLVPVVQCEAPAAARPCTLWLAEAPTGEGRWRLHEVMTAELGLQADLVDFDDAVDVGRFDVDGDGTDDLIVRWSTQGESRPATGPITTDALAVLDGRTLRSVWDGVVASSGASVDAECEGTVTLVDVTCDGRRDIVAELHCWDPACAAATESGDAEAIANDCGDNQLNEETRVSDTTVWPR